MPKRTVAVVLGTRPEIIKLAGVLGGLGDQAVLVHTGQHYDHTMSDAFLATLTSSVPTVQLALGGMNRAEQVGRGTVEIAKVLTAVGADVVVVQGDTNSALAGGLAANCLGRPLLHVEAGLRSRDRSMPEEHNRVVLDHLADVLAAPTATSAANLAAEGIPADAVSVTGNTVVEAVHRQLPVRADRAAIRARLGLQLPYVLATIHRPENTDDPAVLGTILGELAGLPVEVVLPLHPRTRAAAQRHGHQAQLDRLHVIDPLPGATFLGLAADAALLVSDSGGVQEEATVLRRPLLVVRRSTERPEAAAFARLIRPDEIGEAARAVLGDLAQVHQSLAHLPSPFGDGTASRHIVALINNRF